MSLSLSLPFFFSFHLSISLPCQSYVCAWRLQKTGGLTKWTRPPNVTRGIFFQPTREKSFIITYAIRSNTHQHTGVKKTSSEGGGWKEDFSSLPFLHEREKEASVTSTDKRIVKDNNIILNRKSISTIQTCSSQTVDERHKISEIQLSPNKFFKMKKKKYMVRAIPRPPPDARPRGLCKAQRESNHIVK